MRHTLHIVTTVLLALGGSGCGDLRNAPFLVGTVHGQLTESDPAVALVSVVGHPGLQSNVQPDGSFTLEGVPAGAAELFIIASATKALRVPLTVAGGQTVSVGEVEPLEASFLEVRVRAPDHQRVEDTQVSVVGTPLQRLRLGETGLLRVGPLPDGCFTLALSLTGFQAVSAYTCVSAGEEKEVKVNLPAPDKDKGQRGCEVTGCDEGLYCAGDGRCVECLEDTQCSPGLTCQALRCEGSGPLCTPCDGNWKCQSGASCEDLPEGSAACVEECDDEDDECDAGFTCQGGRCLPDSAQFDGCQAYRQVGTSCDGDERCRDLGLVNGLCVAGGCTYRCASDKECPADFSCKDSTFGLVCQPHG